MDKPEILKHINNCEWVELDGFHGDYYVSELGDVVSFKYTKPRVLSQAVNSDGYHTLVLCNGKERLNKRVNRLVAQCFLDGFGDDLQVDHVDGDKLNDCVSNLRLCTCMENIHYKSERLNHSSKYTNVYKHGDKFRTQITIDGEKHHIGTFTYERSAYKAYLDVKKHGLSQLPVYKQWSKKGVMV